MIEVDEEADAWMAPYCNTRPKGDPTMPTHENTPYPAVALQHPAQWVQDPDVRYHN